MNSLLNFWTGLDGRRRIGFVAGLLVIAAIVAAIATWTLRTPYAVLFSGLSESDLGAMATELDRMKVPYRVSDDNAQLLVPESVMHKTRLALMSRELPLHGAVGFELFNTVDFGASDFVQKINYQRALQGELTRTILSIDDIQAARVHLALPEQGLFRKDAEKAKASVTLTMKAGRTLRPLQVTGIQRLVAASVPDLHAEDISVLDQHGVALSRAAGNPDEAAAGAQLDLKASTETYLAHKATELLDRAFGRGAIVVSVDAVFSQETTRVTTDEPLAVRNAASDAAPAGLVVHEHQTVRDAEGGASAAEVTSTETEYQVGHRTEQVTSPAGALTRLEVAAVSRRRMSEADLQRVREIVAATVGLNLARGDVLAVETVDGASDSEGVAEAASAAAEAHPATGTSLAARLSTPDIVLLVSAVLLVLGSLAAWIGHVVRRRRVVVRALNEADRVKLLQTVQAWLVEDVPARDATGTVR